MASASPSARRRSALSNRRMPFAPLPIVGRWSPVHFVMGEPRGEERQIVNQGAAFIVGDILDVRRRVQMPSAPTARCVSPSGPRQEPAHVKGMRDELVSAFPDRYTVAVWVGNLEGDSMRACRRARWARRRSGARRDARALHAGRPGKPLAMPGNVRNAAHQPSRARTARREYFLRGTAQSEMAAAPAAARHPRITSPVSGSTSMRSIPIFRSTGSAWR